MTAFGPAVRGCGCGGDMETCTCGTPPVVILPPVAPDPYRAGMAAWTAVLVGCVAVVGAAWACTPQDHTAPEPRPAVTAPAEGDAGGASGGWDR